MAAANKTNQDREQPSGLEAIPDDVRTEQRDAAYNEMREWFVKGLWPLSAVEMEEKGEWSAQHYRNVLEYYEVEERFGSEARTRSVESESETNSRERDGIDVHIPANTRDPISYVQGYLDAKLED